MVQNRQRGFTPIYGVFFPQQSVHVVTYRTRTLSYTLYDQRFTLSLRPRLLNTCPYTPGQAPRSASTHTTDYPNSTGQQRQIYGFGGGLHLRLWRGYRDDVTHPKKEGPDKRVETMFVEPLWSYYLIPNSLSRNSTYWKQDRVDLPQTRLHGSWQSSP